MMIPILITLGFLLVFLIILLFIRDVKRDNNKNNLPIQKESKKDRSIHELLKLMLEHCNEEKLGSGLCWLAGTLYQYDDMSGNEYHSIKVFIEKHRPNQDRPFSWEIGEVEPRREWLKEQIKLTENEKRNNK
jgi:hypothetical protein